ncbi:uncharacterized protein METZ01_LOCUS34078 [marine metagenome]|uniref:Uncharacterized protein n=1 Tax=marine metagenome TaxID=408172 RepID=A0A381QQI6_9ZZZZ
MIFNQRHYSEDKYTVFDKVFQFGYVASYKTVQFSHAQFAPIKVTT